MRVGISSNIRARLSSGEEDPNRSRAKVSCGGSQLSVLKIDMTYQCAAECEHCRFRCTVDSQPVIDHDMAVECMRVLREVNDLQLVVVMGGEPGLYPGRMLALVRAARDLGTATRVETNCFWATSDDVAREFLSPLVEMGAQLAFSLDAFHEPYVPLERSARAMRIANELGGDCGIETGLLDFEHRDNPFDQRSRQMVEELNDRLGGPHYRYHYQGPLFFAGRSADRLAGLVSPGRGIPQEPCKHVPWWMDGAQDTLELLSLDPDGYISKGCGIAIGNVRSAPLREILKSHDIHEHPILGRLFDRGPIALVEIAAEFGFALQSDYADRCHLCQEVREVLRPKYPDILAPAQHYRRSTP